MDEEELYCFSAVHCVHYALHSCLEMLLAQLKTAAILFDRNSQSGGANTK